MVQRALLPVISTIEAAGTTKCIARESDCRWVIPVLFTRDGYSIRLQDRSKAWNRAGVRSRTVSGLSLTSWLLRLGTFQDFLFPSLAEMDEFLSVGHRRRHRGEND